MVVPIPDLSLAVIKPLLGREHAAANLHQSLQGEGVGVLFGLGGFRRLHCVRIRSHPLIRLFGRSLREHGHRWRAEREDP